MNKITVTVQGRDQFFSYEDGYPVYVSQQVAGGEIAELPGLAITPDLDNHNKFEVTHISSGACMGKSYSSKDEAYSRAIQFLSGIDWTRTREDLYNDEKVIKAVKLFNDYSWDTPKDKG